MNKSIQSTYRVCNVNVTQRPGCQTEMLGTLGTEHVCPVHRSHRQVPLFLGKFYKDPKHKGAFLHTAIPCLHSCLFLGWFQKGRIETVWILLLRNSCSSSKPISPQDRTGPFYPAPSVPLALLHHHQSPSSGGSFLSESTVLTLCPWLMKFRRTASVNDYTLNFPPDLSHLPSSHRETHGPGQHQAALQYYSSITGFYQTILS